MVAGGNTVQENAGAEPLVAKVTLARPDGAELVVDQHAGVERAELVAVHVVAETQVAGALWASEQRASQRGNVTRVVCAVSNDVEVVTWRKRNGQEPFPAKFWKHCHPKTFLFIFVQDSYLKQTNGCLKFCQTFSIP